MYKWCESNRPQNPSLTGSPHPGASCDPSHLQNHTKPSQLSPSQGKLMENHSMKNCIKTKDKKNNWKEKQFVCKFCHKRFSSKENLISHENLHSGIKPHKCSQCSFKASSRENLRYHILKVHTKLRPHQCPHCSFSCIRKSNLDHHMRTHTGEKPFKCPSCDYAAKFKCNLIKHIKINHWNFKIPFDVL